MTGESVVSSVMSSLGTGSGIDIRKLAEDLTSVERGPAEQRLNMLKEQETAQISAYAVLKYNVEDLLARLEELDDLSEVLAAEANSTTPDFVGIDSADATASPGNYTVSVSSLATQQINLSNQYSSKSQSLNAGSGFNLTITDGAGTSTSVAIASGYDTPEGIVGAINASGANISASLIAQDVSAGQYRIVLSGATGSANTFTINSDLSDSDLGFHDANNGNSQQANGVVAQKLASNAVLEVDGLAIERASNVVSDAITGVTLSLKQVHSTGGSSQIAIERANNQLKSKLQGVVDAYNSTRYALSEISDKDSENEEVGGALASDFATIRQVRDVIYKAVTQDSSTASGSISAFRDIGVELLRSGDLQLNEAKFDSAMTNSASDVASMLTAGTNNQSRYDGQSQGLARDVIAKIEPLTDSVDGLFSTRTESSRQALAGYEKQLEELDEKMSELFDRYITQFTVMETLVSQLNSTRTSLADTWMNLGQFGD